MREDREHISPPSIEKLPVDIEKREQELNEVIPMLAHGLVRRLERKGLAGNVRVRAVSGNDWGVAVSPENPAKNVPDIIVYPREYLSKDQKLVNARLRHEVGNLNYPIEEGLNDLRKWCEERGIAPALVTPLVQAVHEASVNYLEVQNAYSAHPEENFKALYEEEVDTAGMAEQVKTASPYKQAVTLTLLYSLSKTGIVLKEHFEQGLAHACTEVRDIFDIRTQSVITQAVKMASPQKQIHLIREHLWPKFSQFVTATEISEAKVETEQTKQSVQTKGEQMESAGLSEIENMHRQVEEMREKLREDYKQSGEKERDGQNRESKKRPKVPSQELGPTEQKERQESQDLLEQALADQLQNIQEQLNKAQEQAGKEAAPQMPQPQTMEELARQAEQLHEQMEELQEAAKEDRALNEQLEALQEQAEQIEDIAEYVADPEKELELEEEPMTYNIKEYGINEVELSEEQKEMLEKVRQFAQETTKVYRDVMRMLMQAYQQKNPNFTDKLISRIKEKGYDLPDFSLYGKEAAGKFLQNNDELGLDGLSGEDFLVNFNLPKPFGRFWYKGGQGSKSIPVKEGEIEWGEFYRRSMPVIYSAVDRAMIQGLYLQRLNEFGQHDYKKYYYLWEAMGLEFPESPQQDQEAAEKSKEDQESGAESDESVEGGEQGEGSEDDRPAEGAESAGESGEAGAGRSSAEGGGEGMPSAQEMQDFLSQVQESLEQATEQSGMQGGQEAMQQMMNELKQMQEALESGASPQDMIGQLSNVMGGLSGMLEGMEEKDKSIEKMSGGQADVEGFEKAQIEESVSQFDPQHQGGVGNIIEGKGVTFKRPDPQLLEELKAFEDLIGSKFMEREEDGNIVMKQATNEEELRACQELSGQARQAQQKELQSLEQLKAQHQKKMEALYGEMSGLEGEALRVYIEYMEEEKELIDDLVEFFVDKFQLNKDYTNAKHQRRGARLERGWQKNIIGVKDRKPVIRPESFERKRSPEKPQFVWTLILDNTGSVGKMINEEKKLAVALIETSKRLDIPLEIVIYTEGGYMFLKSFEQEAYGDDLKKIVLLDATIGNQQDTDLLRAAHESQMRYADKFNRSYNFTFFITDGVACSTDSLHELIQKLKRDTVIVGIGLAQGAETIKEEFGKNALEVQDPTKLSQKFMRKLEDLIDETFD